MSDNHANFTPTLSGYSGQQPFRFWCQKVLPLVYDDSLSYYELLNKIVVYLNNTISDVSSVEGNVESMLAAYENLQYYVNHWFDTVDLTNECYDALNRMAESGELDEIIQPFVESYVAENIDRTVEGQIGGAVAAQIDDAIAEQIGPVVAEQVEEPTVNTVETWLNENVNPVGSAVVVDQSLSISGAAADAEATGNAIGELNTALSFTADSLEYGLIRVNCKKSSGYIDSDGSIHAPQGSNNDKVTDFIPVTAYDVIKVKLKYATTVSSTVYCGLYDSSKAFISRTSMLNNASVKDYEVPVAVLSGASYVRFSYRAFDSGVFNCYKKNVGVGINNLDETVVEKTRNIADGIWTPASYSSDGVLVYSFGNGKNIAITPTIEVVGGKPYTLSWGKNDLNTGTIYIHEFDSYGTRIASSNKSIASYDNVTVTLNSACVKVGFQIYSSLSDDYRKLIPEWIQFEEGERKSEYIPQRIIKKSLISQTIEDVTLSNQLSNTVRTIAHRGDDIFAPQCVAPAYIVARKHGHTVAENDWWYTSDNEFVMWHDTNLAKFGNMVDINGYLMYTDSTDFYWINPEDNAVYTWDGEDYVASAVPLESLARCAGSNYSVVNLPLAVLKRIDFGVYKGKQFKGTQILTLEEWVVLCKKLGMEIYIDKKFTPTDAQVTAAANIVKKHGMGEFASWLGLSISQVALIRTIIPNARCGVLLHPNAENIVTYESCKTGGPFFFNGDAKTNMSEESIQLGINSGFQVEVWYVGYSQLTENEVFATIRDAASYGITGITLDHYRVDEAFKYLLDEY